MSAQYREEERRKRIQKEFGIFTSPDYVDPWSLDFRTANRSEWENDHYSVKEKRSACDSSGSAAPGENIALLEPPRTQSKPPGMMQATHTLPAATNKTVESTSSGFNWRNILITLGLLISLVSLATIGNANVVAVEPCPSIEPDDGTGRPLITGTFKHTSATVIDLQVLGEPEPIGTTANHPFWSVDRNRYVAAGDLRLSERLRTVDDEITYVIGVSPRPGRHDVYNIQVDGQHVFYVGNTGVLVHNTCAPNRGAGQGRRIIPDAQVDPAATVLGNRFGGQASVRLEGFGNREFDFISGRFVGQTFGGKNIATNLKNFLSKSRRAQIRETIRAAQETGRQPLFNFEGVMPHVDILAFINRNAARAGVTPKITNIVPVPR